MIKRRNWGEKEEKGKENRTKKEGGWEGEREETESSEALDLDNF